MFFFYSIGDNSNTIDFSQSTGYKLNSEKWQHENDAM